MIAVDTNLLVYAHREDTEFHEEALKSLLSLATGNRLWGIPWPCVHEFIAITTHPAIYDPPSDLATALDAVDAWMGTPYCRLIGEGAGYWNRLRRTAEQGRVRGPKIHDARIAAICIHHGAQELWTADRDFSRFHELKIRNPLLG